VKTNSVEQALNLSSPYTVCIGRHLARSASGSSTWTLDHQNVLSTLSSQSKYDAK